jgi:hypothetical protein
MDCLTGTGQDVLVLPGALDASAALRIPGGSVAGARN